MDFFWSVKSLLPIICFQQAIIRYQQQPMIVKAFTKHLRARFAMAKPGQKPIQVEEFQDITLAFYYRRLLRNSKVKPNGNSKFNPFELHYMAKLTESPEEAELLFEAYYNFLGHNTNVSQKTSDIVVKKYIEAKGDPLKVLQLFRRHRLIRYFPHYETTQMMTQYVSQQPQHLKSFLKILRDSPFIKINDKIVLKVLETLNASQDKKTLRSFYVNTLERHPDMHNIRSPQMIDYLSSLKHIPQGEHVNSLISTLEASSQNNDIVKLARLYLSTDQSLEKVFQLLSRLPSIDVQGMEQTFQRIYTKCRYAFKTNPQLYDSIVQQYGRTLKAKSKETTLAQIQSRILNIPNQPKRTPEPQAQEQQQGQPQS